ncbi:MAG: LicD family protein [Dorea sp.]|nr:LicD family protein [Dorea sp.]
MKLTTFNMMKKMPDNLDGLVVLEQEQVEALQKILFEILNDIADVCEQYQISYTLGGGSVLGALRHQGFIPWDDDIDINMPRAEYKKFIPLFRKHFGHKYWIHTPEETRGYALPMAKVRLKNTIMKERDDFRNPECGVGLDIFIIENTFNNPILRKIHGIGSLGFGFLLSCRKFFRDRKELLDYGKRWGKVAKAFYIKIAIGAVLSILPIGFWCKASNWWNSICHDSDSIYVSGCGGRLYFFGELYRRDEFCVSRQEVFEGRLFPVPVKAEQYLEHCYGNWEVIPDMDNREKHILFDFSIENCPR